MNMMLKKNWFKNLILALACCLTFSVSALAQSPNIISGAIYKLRNQCSLKALDVSGASQNDGALMQQWTDYSNLNQQFKIEATDSGYYKLTAQHSQKVVDVQFSQTADGTVVWQYTSNGTSAQQWRLIETGDGFYKLESRLQAGKVLDVSGASTADGARVQLWSDNNTCAQRWRLELASEYLSTLQQLRSAIPSWMTEIPSNDYSVPSNAIFVAPNGDPNATGTDINRPTTLAKALTTSLANSVVVLRGGTYRGIELDSNGSLQRVSNLTLQAYPGEQPWISGSAVVTGWTRDGNGWRRNNWSNVFPGNPDPANYKPGFELARRREMAFLNGISLIQVGSRSELQSGTFYLDETNHVLWLGDDPSGKIVEATVAEYGLGTWSLPVTVRGIGFKHYAGAPFKLWRGAGAARVTIEKCAFVWNGEHGFLGWGQPYETRPARQFIIRDNRFVANAQDGASDQRATGTLYQNNLFAHNNIENHNQSLSAAGLKAVSGDGYEFFNNTFENNNGTGLWLDVSTRNVKVAGNIARGNNGIGIFSELSKGTLIAFNVVERNSFIGIGLSNTEEAQVWNNTMVNNGLPDGGVSSEGNGSTGGISVNDDGRVNTPTGGGESGYDEEGAAAGVTWITRNNIICNNIVTGSVPALNGIYTTENSVSNNHVSRVDYNVYLPVSNRFFIRWDFEPPLSSAIRDFASLSAFTAASGWEANGIRLTASDALFLNAEARDYRLRSESLAATPKAALPASISSLPRIENRPVPPGAGAF